MHRKLLVLLALFILLVAPVSAIGSGVFFPNFTSYDDAKYNVSYVYGFPNATPLPIVFFVAILGICLIVLSNIVRIDQGADIISIMALAPLAIAAWQFLTVDIVTGFGVTSQLSALDTQLKPPYYMWVLMEQHTIYQMYAEAVLMVIFFAIGLLNVYRIISLSRLADRTPEQEDTDIQ